MSCCPNHIVCDVCQMTKMLSNSENQEMNSWWSSTLPGHLISFSKHLPILMTFSLVYLLYLRLLNHSSLSNNEMYASKSEGPFSNGVLLRNQRIGYSQFE